MLRHVPIQGSIGGRTNAVRRTRSASSRTPRGSVSARAAGRRGAARHRPAAGRPRRTPVGPPTAAASPRLGQLPLAPALTRRAEEQLGGHVAGRRRLGTPGDDALRRRASPGRSGSRRGRGSRPARRGRDLGRDAGTSTSRLAVARRAISSRVTEADPDDRPRADPERLDDRIDSTFRRCPVAEPLRAASRPPRPPAEWASRRSIRPSGPAIPSPRRVHRPPTIPA